MISEFLCRMCPSAICHYPSRSVAGRYSCLLLLERPVPVSSGGARPVFRAAGARLGRAPERPVLARGARLRALLPAQRGDAAGRL